MASRRPGVAMPLELMAGIVGGFMVGLLIGAILAVFILEEPR